MTCTDPEVPDVVFSFGYRLWSDAEPFGPNAPFSPHRMARALVADGSIPRLVVVDAYRSRLARMRGRPRTDVGFPTSPDRTILGVYRWRRFDGRSLTHAQATYRRLDDLLRRISEARGLRHPVLVTCHPVHAALADEGYWADVVYYGWDDWLECPPMQQLRRTTAWAYSQMAARDVNVVGVTQAIVDRIGSARSTVIPNALLATQYDELSDPPDWYRRLPRPLALYAGALEERVDVDAILRAARDLPEWTFCLVGPAPDTARLTSLRGQDNININSPVGHSTVMAMASEATVCLVPHRRTAMSVAMSPLKLYEYLGAGAPVVAADLEPIRGVSDRVLLVKPGTPYAAAIVKAAALSAIPRAELEAWRLKNDWDERYQRLRDVALTRRKVPGNGL